MRCLLEHGADIDALDNDHVTPLHLASRHGCVEGARLLLEHGANVHLEDNTGRTPFQVASEEGLTEEGWRRKWRWREEAQEKEGRAEIAQLLSEYLQSQQTM